MSVEPTTYDRFATVKAMLDTINRHASLDAAEDLDKIKQMIQSLKRIKEIPEDDVGNGLRLAKSIADSALEVYYARS